MQRWRKVLRHRWWTLAVIGALAAGALVVGACGGSDSTTTGSQAAAGADPERKNIRIIFAMAGIPGDPYYTRVKNGAKQAGKDMGVTVEYRETQQYDFQEQVRLIRAAVAQKPDALVVSEENPEVLDGPVKEAVDAGIPVIIATAGRESAAKTGALSFVGQNEFEVGRLAGEQLKAKNVRKVLCINPYVGIPALDERCAGLKTIYGANMKVVPTDADLTVEKNRIKAALQSNPDYDGMLGLAATTSESALNALEESNMMGKIKLGGIDLNPRVLEAVRDDEMIFASDQQQYLGGYLPVVFLTLHKLYGFRPPPFVATGPSYVTKENIELAIAKSKLGIR